MRTNAYDDHRTINTTRGPVEVPRGERLGPVNTSRAVEEDMVYEDEEQAEIVQILDARGWAAMFEDGRQEELIFWCVLDDDTVHGVILGEDGLVDLTEGNVEKLDGFKGYVNNTTKENQ